MNIKSIQSVQNPFIKELVLLLEKSKIRKQSRTFVAEGLREVSLCVKAGYSINKLIYNASKINLEEIQKATSIDLENCEIIEVNSAVFEKIAYRSEIENVVVVAQQKVHTIDAAKLALEKNKTLFLVVAGIEKPGNLGAILRSADATGAVVVVCDPTCDVYNPNVIRSSVGTVFTTNIVISNREEIVHFFKENKINYYTTFMDSNSVSLFSADLSNNAAVILGTESSGLEEDWRNENIINVNLPMLGIVDSLNVSVAASVIMYEAVRQKLGT